jgi:hypothetical protein
MVAIGYRLFHPFFFIISMYVILIAGSVARQSANLWLNASELRGYGTMTGQLHSPQYECPAMQVAPQRGYGMFVFAGGSRCCMFETCMGMGIKLTYAVQDLSPCPFPS